MRQSRYDPAATRNFPEYIPSSNAGSDPKAYSHKGYALTCVPNLHSAQVLVCGKYSAGSIQIPIPETQFTRYATSGSELRSYFVQVCRAINSMQVACNTLRVFDVVLREIVSPAVCQLRIG